MQRGVCCEYPKYPTATVVLLGTHSTLGYRRHTLVDAAASFRGVWYAGQWLLRRARGYRGRHRQRQRRRLDPREHNGACALLSTL
jgi:hypothetical protein